MIAERLDSDTIQIVVQGFLPSLLIPGASVYVSGFKRSRDGGFEEMSAEELHSYD